MDTSRTVLLFELAGNNYSLPLNNIDEIVPAVELLPSPFAQQSVEGLLDLRGAIIPVLNLAEVLNVSSKPSSYLDHFIVMHGDSADSECDRIAVRVDRALELASIPPDSSLNGNGHGLSTKRIFRHNDVPVICLYPEMLMPVKSPG